MTIYIDALLDKKLQKMLKKGAKNAICIFKTDLKNEKEQIEALLKADIIFGNPSPVELLEQAKNLKWLQLQWAGFDGYRNLEIPATITNMQDYFSQPCAETAIAGIMALYRGMDAFTLLKAKKNWVGYVKRADLHLLEKKRVLILGAGTIGKRTGKILKGFSAKVHFYARTPRKGVVTTAEEVEALIPKVDIIIGCLPGTAEVTGFFTNKMLNLMKPSALFCNIGRGNLVADEMALATALKENKIAGAVLDVTVKEPLPIEHPFWDCPNTILSQHSAGGNATEYAGLVAFFLKNLKRFQSDQPLLNPIELSRGY